MSQVRQVLDAMTKLGSRPRSTVDPARAAGLSSPTGDDERRRLGGKAAFVLDRLVGWHRLPLPISIGTLIGLRGELRRKNLFDPLDRRVDVDGHSPDHVHSRWRSTDGSDTEPSDPSMGRAKEIFGRNVPLPATGRDDADVLDPDPRLVSDRLLARDGFIPATSLNMLAAAWVQFEVHDWTSHGENDVAAPWTLPATARHDAMAIDRTHHADGDSPTTYRNEQTHWWDASQVYGSTKALAKDLRAGARGHLRLDDHHEYPHNPPDVDRVPKELRPAGNSWWVGLAFFHTLFAREHNSVCDHLAAAYPDWSDDELYQRARLINAALIAKIHTLEWTPAMLANPRTEMALRINWRGLRGEGLPKVLARVVSPEVWNGIPGSHRTFDDVPYALTEEFVAVYRMHALIPDEIELPTVRDGAHRGAVLPFTELAGAHTAAALREHGMANLAHALATNHPGQLVLRNYPTFLRQLELPGDRTIDLATVDVLRDRERGVPRYNDFRRALRLPPITRFEDFSDDPEIVTGLREVYGNPERVDLMVGLYAEKKPDGFAFSDTAFRVFILMASRRLSCDRFFTDDYDDATYTPEGMAWIERTTLATVIGRHFPQLESALQHVRNPFQPWDAPPPVAGRVESWARRQRWWNRWIRLKFAAAEPLHVNEPDDDEIGEVAFRARYRDIPIDGLVVADRFPENEHDPLALNAIRIEEQAARFLPPADDDLPPISADPHAALERAYPASSRRRYRAPERPPGYDPVPDLGLLAVKSPYAYLLTDVDGSLRWDLSVLGEITDLQPGLLSPWAIAHFSDDGTGVLRATAIDTELGTARPGEHDWHLATRLAMCAAHTHVTLVRHFNWIHLVAGERLALATNRLPAAHPVRRLLAPHVFATHIGNRIVTPIQLAPGGDFERMFSYTHAGLCRLFEATIGSFDMRAMNPELDTARRRVPAHIEQPALDNRRDLLEAIRDHVTRYVDHYRPGDAPLDRWIGELARVPGVSEIVQTGDDGLVELLTTMIYMVSVEHEIVDSAVWDYHLWSDVSTPRVYADGGRMPLDVYQRVVNNNFILNVDRTRLMDDFSYLALDDAGRRLFRRFSSDLYDLQRRMDREQPTPWRIQPRNLKANINY